MALAAGVPVGFALLSFEPDRPGVAVHEMTGVTRAWRRRGIATALKEAQVRWAQAAGLATLSAANDASNVPMRRINEHLGYRPVGGDVQLSGPMPVPRDGTAERARGHEGNDVH